MIIGKLIQTLTFLVIYPHDHPDIANNECLTQNYLGTYGTQSVFTPPQSCLSSVASTIDVPTLPIHPDSQFVWVEQAALEEYLIDYPFSPQSLQGYLGSLPDIHGTAYDSHPDNQQPLSSPIERQHILYHASTSALLALSPSHVSQLSHILPPTWRIYVLPSKPFPYLPVPESAIARVRDLLLSLKFKPDVAKIVSNISLAQMRNDVRFLTGEDSRSGIESRHSFSSDARVAVEWLKVRFQETGALCELQSFLPGFAPNVIWYVTKNVFCRALFFFPIVAVARFDGFY
jgi:hypothetical protein